MVPLLLGEIRRDLSARFHNVWTKGPGARGWTPSLMRSPTLLVKPAQESGYA